MDGFGLIWFNQTSVSCPANKDISIAAIILSILDINVSWRAKISFNLILETFPSNIIRDDTEVLPDTEFLNPVSSSSKNSSYFLPESNEMLKSSFFFSITLTVKIKSQIHQKSTEYKIKKKSKCLNWAIHRNSTKMSTRFSLEVNEKSHLAPSRFNFPKINSFFMIELFKVVQKMNSI